MLGVTHYCFLNVDFPQDQVPEFAIYGLTTSQHGIRLVLELDEPWIRAHAPRLDTFVTVRDGDRVRAVVGDDVGEHFTGEDTREEVGEPVRGVADGAEVREEAEEGDETVREADVARARPGRASRRGRG